jgi:hypothetical protein
MTGFDIRAQKRWKITADFSLSDNGLMTLKVIGFARKPSGGLAALATSIPVDGIPDRYQRRQLEERYIRRLVKRIKAFERGELPEPPEGSFLMEPSQL